MSRWDIAVAGVLLAGGAVWAQQEGVWQSRPGVTQVPIWPSGKIPDARPMKGPEMAKWDSDPKDLVAGKGWTYVENVATPTMTVYPAKGRNTGAAMLVFPGGGYEILAMDLEGYRGL